jgi:uncharacterized protein (DUF1800 family)
MGDASTPLGAAEARHLLRRTGFGLPRKNGRLTAAQVVGRPRGEVVDELLAFRPKGSRPRGGSIADAQNKWIKLMLKAKGGYALQEKTVLFLHDHFATNFSTVQDVGLMADQNRTLRLGCKGSFKDLVKRINVDPAMMDFLDTVRNRKQQPNENYARELLELFTLGVEDLNGQPAYAQEDIVQIARAFTGWRHDDKVGTHYLRQQDHDFMAQFPARGPKVIFKTHGGFGPAGRSFTAGGEGENEIDEVVDVIFEHTDSEGQSTVARHLAWKLLQYFAHPAPAKSVVDEVVAASGFAGSWELAALLRAIFLHDAFYETAAAAPFDAATRKSVKWPVDYVLGTLRTLEGTPTGRELRIQGGGFGTVRGALETMGQELFQPPSVFGWDWEEGWVSSAAMLARYAFARDLTSARTKKPFRPEKLLDPSLTEPGAIVDAVTGLLGVSDQLGEAERGLLVDYLTDGGAHPTLNLFDPAVRNEKLHGLFALVLQSPAYQVH